MEPKNIPLTAYQFRLLAVLALINFVNFADRQVVVPLLPLLRQQMGVTDAQLGSLQTWLLVVLAVVSFPSGFLADRFSRTRIIAGGVLFWSLATIACGFAPTFLLLIVSRALIGVGEASYAPAAQSMISDSFPHERRALAQSRNIPALKLANKVGIKAVIDYAARFGITAKLPPYLPVALGSAEIKLIEQTSAYSVFPNDGVRVIPRYITRVTDYEGRVLEEDFPDVKDVISERTARIMTSMLREVVLHGTGVAAAKLPFPVAGKTGTTNDFTDAWFVGFSPTMTCGVWVGYDEKKSLGAKETGAHAALPIWMNFMTVAMAGKDAGDFNAPPAVSHAVAQKVDTPDAAPATEESH